MTKPNERLYNPQTEMALMAAAMFDRDLLLLDVTGDDFHDAELGCLWDLAAELVAAGRCVDHHPGRRDPGAAAGH